MWEALRVLRTEEAECLVRRVLALTALVQLIDVTVMDGVGIGGCLIVALTSRWYEVVQ